MLFDFIFFQLRATLLRKFYVRFSTSGSKQTRITSSHPSTGLPLSSARAVHVWCQMIPGCETSCHRVTGGFWSKLWKFNFIRLEQNFFCLNTTSRNSRWREAQGYSSSFSHQSPYQKLDKKFSLHRQQLCAKKVELRRAIHQQNCFEV